MPSRCGEGALTAPQAPNPEDRCLGGPNARRGPARQPPAGKAPASPRRLPAHGRTNASAHTHTRTHTHNKRKPCEPRAEVWSRRSGQRLPRPHRSAPGPHSLERSGGAVGARIVAARGPRPSSARPHSRAVPAAARREALGPTPARLCVAAPPADKPSDGNIPPERLTDPAWAPKAQGTERLPIYRVF